MNLPLERFRFLSTDKITGRTFKLCAEGESEDAAAEKIWGLGFLVSGVEPCPWVSDPTLKPKLKFLENGESVEDFDHLYGRVNSVLNTDFATMVREFNTQCDPEDRHWLLNGLVDASNRSADPNTQILTELFCWQWFVERHEIVRYMVPKRPKNDTQGMMYQVPAVNRLRIMHEGERKAQVCEYATDLPYPLPDHHWLIKKAADYREGHI